MSRGDGGKIKPAVDFFGSQAEMQRKLGIKNKAQVNHWVRRGIPAFWAIKIEEATKGAVTTKMLLPKLNEQPKQPTQ